MTNSYMHCNLHFDNIFVSKWNEMSAKKFPNRLCLSKRVSS
uniref:Uncharacterized protein n=1 Tax=Rhizophora mucronata TaxID=61149 RepID=A0A2P2INZ5_RHIMU